MAASLLGSGACAAGDQSAAAAAITELGLQAPSTALILFLALILVIITYFSVCSLLVMFPPDSKLYEDSIW